MGEEIPKELLDMHEKRLHEMLEIVEKGDWKLSKEETNIKFYTGTYPGSSFNMVKSVVTILGKHKKTVELLDTVKTIDKNTPKEEAKGVKERYVFGGAEGGPRYLYMSLQSGSMLVSDRDFLTLRKRYDLPDKQVWLIASIDNDDLKPPTKDNVRGKMTFQAFILEQDKDDDAYDRLTFVVHADPCGSIPAMVYNAVATKQGYNVLSIRNSVLKKE
ncbi:hypothetical protein TVAG_109640 [Trichomonas vaginalis G3]|uniref:START domain-containing protein n=1 Tax=Trichomonas vaginalis (strain ATCC PRA-98 / G3) TaxID=412133 RepID=A2EAF3_TRIV3|nr:lipid-binding START domain-containing protein [Trichomonas vaginalis G3]EAY10380.1 hypothetical protein TVAG_109640 [Trichomonas vaginalis G3]KAI5485330.1 lipid-binding START domain-containing protein [Trichomonas vaginalis G3]|eukprot:XP_001322603.1 hypothetical protein [Trichomonas vaginalis G3]